MEATKKKTKIKPTPKSLAVLRAQGYTCEVVEYWNHFTRRRHDLFGFIDIIAIRENETLAVQVTSSGVSARVKKITESPYLADVRKAGWRIEVHGWTLRKQKGTQVKRYVQRVVDLS